MHSFDMMIEVCLAAVILRSAVRALESMGVLNVCQGSIQCVENGSALIAGEGVCDFEVNVESCLTLENLLAMGTLDGVVELVVFLECVFGFEVVKTDVALESMLFANMLKSH